MPEAIDRNYELAIRSGNRKALGETLRQAQGGKELALISRLRAPTLILWGEKDAVIPPMPEAERFHREIAGSSLFMLPGIGHSPHERTPPARSGPSKTFWLRKA